MEGKSMTGLDKFLLRCVEDITTAILVEKADGSYPCEAETAVHTNDGWIEIYVSPVDGKRVDVLHNGNVNKRSDNLTNAILEVIPEWGDVEEEGHEYGIDPGFASYSDYIDYKYN